MLVAPGLLVLLYGVGGSGKTTLAASFLEYLEKTTGKLGIYHDWEGGVTALPSSVPYDYLPAQHTLPIQEAIKTVRSVTENPNCSGLVEDTISAMGASFLRQTTLLPLKQAGTRDTIKLGTSNPFDVIAVPTQADYGIAQTSFGTYYMECRQALLAGKHILWIAHEQVIDVEDSNRQTVSIVGGPDIIGSKLTRTIPTYPQIVMRIKLVVTANGTDLVLKTYPDGVFHAKDRTRSLPMDFKLNPPNRIPPDSPEFDKFVLENGTRIWSAMFTKYASIAERLLARSE